MPQYLLDTDHLTLLELGLPSLVQRIATQPAGAVATSAITVEEVLRGRLGYLSRPLDSVARQRGYALLVGTVRLLNQLPIVLPESASEIEFQGLQHLRTRLGTQDRRIAAVALANGFVLLTRNQSDFGQVARLKIEDWTK